MTIDTFILWLSTLPLDWRLRHDRHRVRLSVPAAQEYRRIICPISAVARSMGHVGQSWEDDARWLDLDSRTVDAILDASDGYIRSEQSADLRARMIEAIEGRAGEES